MTQIPESAADLTPAWLTAALQGSGFVEASVEALTIAPLGGDESLASEVVKITPTYTKRGGAPAALVAKLPSLQAVERGQLFASSGYQREADFYRELAGEVGIATPRCYYAACDDLEQRYCILLDFLDGGTVGDNVASADREMIERAAVALAQMHARWWNSQALPRRWLRSYIDGAVPGRLIDAVPVYLERYGDAVPQSLHPVVSSIAQWYGPSGTRLAQAAVTLIHGDCSVKNLFFPDDRDAPVVAFDWALVGYGPAARDLANLLVISLEPEARAACERDIAQLYAETLRQAGVLDYPTRADLVRLPACDTDPTRRSDHDGIEPQS